MIGSGAMLAEIESALVGMTAGRGEDLDVDVPGRLARARSWPARPCRCTVKAEQVSEPVLPEVDAAFIRSFGVQGRRAGAVPQAKSAATSSASSRAR